jgi:hypothetical protein
MTDSPWRPLAVTLAIAVACTRLIPEEYRLLNFAAAGAVALFAAARLGVGAAVLIAGGGMLLSDLLLWKASNYNPDYLPMPSVYLGLVGYLLVGRLVVGRIKNPLVAGAASLPAAAVGGVWFFVVTNFASWLAQALPYGYSLAGLMDCFQQGLPFYRGTLFGDLTFTGLLFAAHTAVAYLVRPAELKPVTVTVEDGK